MDTSQYDIVLLDPVSDGGLSVLDLSAPGRRVVAVLMLRGPAAVPLYQRMNLERASLDTAVTALVDEIRTEAGRRNLTIKEWVRVVSSDAVGAMVKLAEELPGARILLPETSDALGPDGMERLMERCGAEIVTPSRRRVA